MLCSFPLHHCYKVREKEQEQAVNQEPPPSEATSEMIKPRHDRMRDYDHTGDSSNMGHFSSFPILPLPPREHPSYRYKNQQWNTQTEDKMGTLHNVIIDTRQQPVQSSDSSRTSSHKDRCAGDRRTSNQPSAVRFVPRTTCLENRKRKLEEVVPHSLSDVPEKNYPLIGPKLPEPPKLDMEDESLNTTVSQIRSTMKQVSHFRCFSEQNLYFLSGKSSWFKSVTSHLLSLVGGISSWPQTSGKKGETTSPDLINPAVWVQTLCRYCSN